MRISGRNLNKKDDNPYRQPSAPVYRQPVYVKRSYRGIIIGAVILSVVLAIPTVLMLFGMIGAVAIPNLLSSRKAANEATVMNRLRNLHTAQTTYYSSAGQNKYGSLEDLISAKLIDDALASPKFTYAFTMTRSASADRYCMAANTSQQQQRSFGISNDGVIYQSTSGDISCQNGELKGGGMKPLQ